MTQSNADQIRWSEVLAYDENGQGQGPLQSGNIEVVR